MAQQSMGRGRENPICDKRSKARGSEWNPICELPYGPATLERSHQRPDRCQHPTTRSNGTKILLAFNGASTDVANFSAMLTWHDFGPIETSMMFKGRHFDQSVILLCVRWYLAYNLSLRDLEEMMSERGIVVDHSTVNRWVRRFSPMLLERFNRRKRSLSGKWRMDETYIKVRGQWMYLYRAIDSVGDTVEFLLSEQRDLLAAKRFLRKALSRHGRPDRIVIDGSQTNQEAITACDGENRLRDRTTRSLKPIRNRRSQYLNNRIEQDHRRIKRRVRSMMGFKAFSSAEATLAGIEMVHMMRKRQGRFAFNPEATLKEQFEAIAA